MIQLTKDEEQKIEAEAIAMYPTMEADKFLWYEAERIGYIAGATSERIKAKELYFLVELIADGFPVTQHNAKQALLNYNKLHNG